MGPGTDLHSIASPGVYTASAWVRLDGAAASQMFMTAKITCTGAADQFVRIGTAAAAPGPGHGAVGRRAQPERAVA